MGLSDSELIQACIEKDKKAWDLFVDRFSKLIYWSIRKTFAAYAFANREEQIQEVFQTVFERLIEKEALRRLQNAASIRKFLSLMACHAALDKAKAQWRFEGRVVSEENLAMHPGHGAASSVLANERAAIVEATLGELSPKERACVEFHYFNELTFREIAGILNISEDAASSVVKRAKDKIRNGLAKRDF